MTSFSTIDDNHVTIIGAGNMGSGIAQKYASSGFRVTVVDKFEDSLKLSQQSIQDMLDQGVKRKIFDSEHAKLILSRMSFTSDIKACQDASLVIEAIFEDLDKKRQLLSHLEQVCNSKAILASNTSSFLIHELQNGLKHPERVIGLHYFFHPAKNRLVEIIGTDTTEQEFLNKACNYQESLKKIVIKSKDSPGFIVNRFFVPWLNQAMHIVHEGITNIATVDQAAKHFFKINMGPFELMNVTGLPITLHSCHSMAQRLGNFYSPCPLILPQIETKQPWSLVGEVSETKLSYVFERLLSVVSAICCQMVFEEEVCNLIDVDLSAKVGLLWQKGPFELTNTKLDDTLTHALRDIKKNNSSFYVPDILKHKLSKQTRF
jgi:enoyl-CoA hydratase/3-hydroxyacyl-CoA dehydrogenase